MIINYARMIVGICMGIGLFAGLGLAVEPTEVERFVNARIEIGEMMTNYFLG